MKSRDQFRSLAMMQSLDNTYVHVQNRIFHKNHISESQFFTKIALKKKRKKKKKPDRSLLIAQKLVENVKIATFK